MFINCILMLTSFLASCAQLKEEQKMNNNFFTLPQNCNFLVTVNNSAKANECSPIIDDAFSNKFKGIVINSARSIEWPKNSDNRNSFVSPNGDTKGPIKFMISGLIQLPKNTLDLDGDFSHNVVVVAVNHQNTKTYSGKMNRSGFKSPSPIIFNDDESNKSAITRKYFNVDLIANLDVPLEEATYTVYATLGEFKSNELVVTTKLK